MKKKILFVCLGNICRSPAAEGVFLNLIKKNNLEDQFYIDSAGTGGWHVGNQADERMRIAAQKRGINIESIARKITPDDFRIFDLILTMDNQNLLETNSLAKNAGLHSFEKIRPILSYSMSTKSLEVPDPYYGGENGFEKVLDLLEESCQRLLETICVQG